MTKSSEAGCSDGLAEMARYYHTSRTGFVGKNLRMHFDLLVSSAKQKSPLGLCLLAYCYFLNLDKKSILVWIQHNRLHPTLFDASFITPCTFFYFPFTKSAISIAPGFHATGTNLWS
jgi:hypothetical protein